MLKLLDYNVNGRIYNNIKNMYQYTESCVRINDLYTDWFQTKNGVGQGDSLSPTLFSIFINDLAIEIKNKGLGVKVGNVNTGILMYADDTAIMTENERDMNTTRMC